MSINKEGCDDDSLLFFICNLNLNCSFFGGKDLRLKVDKESEIKRGSKRSSFSRIGKLEGDIKGEVGAEVGAEEGKEEGH